MQKASNEIYSLADRLMKVTSHISVIPLMQIAREHRTKIEKLGSIDSYFIARYVKPLEKISRKEKIKKIIIDTIARM